MSTEFIDQKRFQQIMFRNVLMPLAMAIGTCIVFVFLVLHLVSVNHWVEHTDQVIARAHEIHQMVVDGETGYRGFLLTGQDEFLEPYERTSTNIDAVTSELKGLVSDNLSQVSRMDHIISLQKDWQKFAARVIDEKRAHRDVLRIVNDQQGKRMMDGLRAELRGFVGVEERLRVARNEEAARTVNLFLLLILGGSGVTGALLAWNGRKQLRYLSESYQQAMSQQIEQNRMLEKQAWIKTSQNELNEIVRDAKGFSELATRLLGYLARHFDANAGGFYAAQPDGTFMRVAGFGLPSEQSERPPRYRLGETLVGQAAIERRVLAVPGVQASHLKISSTLLEMPPTEVIVVPAVGSDNRVRAIYELGLPKALADRDRELLSAASEIIASAVRSAQDDQRLRELLEETQRQAEELQAQQEELRVNNEELEEQSRALKESQSRLEGQQAELEQTNSQLEEQQRALETQADDLADKNRDLEQARAGVEEKARLLEQASQYKSQFLANMSHELRTPLNSTLILAKLLKDNQQGNLTADQVEMAETIGAAGNDLLSLINDILDLAKVEAGKLDLHPETVSLARVSGDLERVFRPLAENKHVSLEISMASDLPRAIETDRQRLEQILRNLLSNAIKFTERGGVTVRFARSPTMISFAITDTGIGIAREQQQVVFEAFKQADGTTNRKYGGTGLGLAISRDLAHLLGGRIEIESTPGKGSTFILYLPEKMPERGVEPAMIDSARLQGEVSRTPTVSGGAGTASKPREKPAKSAVPTPKPDDRSALAAHGRLLLIVEDDESFAKILLDLGHELGFQCVIASSAEEGVLMALELLPQAILLDMQLPDHSGLTVLDRLKGNARTRHIPIHVISATDQSQAALQMGAIGYLLKPSTRTELIDAVAKLEDKLAQRMRRVLVVEDNLVQRESIKRLIQTEKVHVTAVSKGSEALSELAGQSAYDCMIVDLNLPDMSGYELLEAMTLGDASAHPPVIIYTGRVLTREEESKLQKYSRSIIIKGARSPERLLSEVTLFLHQVESALPKDRQEMLSGLRNRDQVFEGRRILVVDDDVRNIFALTSALEPRGGKIDIGRNGKEALAQLEAHPEIDLVLMDIMMPEMDGYEAMRQIRANPRLKHLPIIAITAKAMREDQELCLAAGANDYLSKPIDLEKLLSLIRVWLPAAGRGI